MLDLFEFLTVFNLLVILLCIIGLYWSINLVIDYYAPTSTNFVNMYFLYYIFFTFTLLVAVGCNNYIEMNSVNIVDAAAVVVPADTVNPAAVMYPPQTVNPAAVMYPPQTVNPAAVMYPSQTVIPAAAVIPGP